MKTKSNLSSNTEEILFAHTQLDQQTCGTENFVANNWGSSSMALPHKTLLQRGEPVASFLNKDHLYLVHFTKNLEAIKSTGKLLSSPGNLINVVYCLPAKINKDKGFSFHNYGLHIFKHLNPDERNLLSPLVIDIDLTAEKEPLILGVNYLKMGPLYWNAFESCSNLPATFHTRVNAKYSRAMNLLSGLNPWLKGKYSSPKVIDSIKEAVEIINTVAAISASESLFSFFYLEAISLNLMYSSNDPQTLVLLEKNETNNYLYIKTVHELSCQSSDMFAAHTFHPTCERLIKVIAKEIAGGYLSLDLDTFIINTSNTLLYYFDSWLVNSKYENDNKNLSLLGQLASLEVYFNWKECPEFASCVGNKLTSMVHNYWNDSHCAVVINSCTPKGEVGINPVYKGLKYQIFNCELDKTGINLLPLSEIKAQISLK